MWTSRPALALGLRVVEPQEAEFQRLVWGVAALVHAISDTLAARFAACTVRGELSGYSRAASGHCYFTLKDADGDAAAIRCAMFKRAASLLQFTPADGQQVQLRGRVAVYEPRGELQFIVESMQRSGDGSLYEQFLRLKHKLETEGLFDPARKRPLAQHPRRIGIVTSLGGAVLHDVATSLARRAPQVELLVYPSLVQGSEAPAALVAAIELAGQRREVDTLLICRGGGSIEDLWAFNDERVVRAIAACPIPVVSGVGHETDTTLADFVADLRAPTPTAAAELSTASAASAVGAKVVVDSTFATPICARPLEQGASLVIHSGTKFIGGHSDLMIGLVVAADEVLHDRVRHTRLVTGGTPGALEAFLALRGVRTLPLRMERAQSNAAHLVERLRAHDGVDEVRYPGSGAMVSFVVRGGADAADALCRSVQLIVPATSLGGVETTLERRQKYAGDAHVPPGLIRMSVGIEHVDDVWADLAAALPASPSA